MSQVKAAVLELISDGPASALAEYRKLLAAISGPATYRDPRAKALELLAAAKAAGLTAEDLRRDCAAEPAPPKRRVHLFASMYFQTLGSTLNSINIRDLISASGGRVDLEPYQIVATEAQSPKDVEQLLQAAQDYNHHRPGNCDEGIALLKKSGLPSGSINDVGSCLNVASRFKLYELKLSCIEAAIIRSRGSSTDMKELVYQRLGLGGLCKSSTVEGHLNKVVG